MKTTTQNPIADLRHLLSVEQVLTAEEAGKPYTHDFGKLRYEIPLVVVRCHDAADIVAVVKYANDNNLHINPRGEAHSQNNTATSAGGILLDMSLMDAVYTIDEEGHTVTCAAGLTWHELIKQTLPLGLVPPVLTSNLNVSVGGTLSVGGIGIATFKHGSQCDNLIELEVVTGAGDLVTCSETENKDLFDIVRAGLGQFGIITKATLKLRTCKPNVRKYFLLYDDLGKLMDDCSAIVNDKSAAFETMEGACRPCMMGTKNIGEGLELGTGVQIFAHWLFPLYVTVEYNDGEEPDDAEMLKAFGSAYRHVHTDNLPIYELLNRMEPLFGMMRTMGTWDAPHPWMDTILPWHIAQVFIEQMLTALPPNALGATGQVLIWPSTTAVSDVPLLKITQADQVIGLGVLPAIPEEFTKLVHEKMKLLSDFSVRVGSKRYLSGVATFNGVEDWQEHYGESWELMVAGKKKFDPNAILSPGFVIYD